MHAQQTQRTGLGLALGLLIATAPLAAAAQTAQLGSDGSDGALSVSSDMTLPLPADGVFHYTTITIAAGATLRFSTADTHHPGVVLLATGDVVVDGTIDISGADGTATGSGAAGPGGTPGSGPFTAGAIVDRSPSDTNWRVRNSSPTGFRQTGMRLAGGQGRQGSNNGSGTGGGGGGGGALLIVSNTAIRGTGALLAAGGASGTGWSGTAQGGTFRLIAPRVTATDLAVTTRYLRLDALMHTDGPPDTTNILIAEMGNDLAVWPANLPTATITEVEGIAASTSEVLILPAGTAEPYDITVRVQGCTASSMRVYVIHQAASNGVDGWGTPIIVSAPTGDDTVNVPIAPGITPTNIHTNQLTPVVHCGADSIP